MLTTPKANKIRSGNSSSATLSRTSYKQQQRRALPSSSGVKSVKQKKSTSSLTSKKKAVSSLPPSSRRNARGGGQAGKALFPARQTVTLEFPSQFQLTASTTHNSWAYPLYTNAAYAPDPEAPSGYSATPQFSVWAARYASYRVKKYYGEVSFSSQLAAGDSCDTVVLHSNTKLAATGGGTLANVVLFAATRPGLNTVKPIGQAANNDSLVKHHFSHNISSITGESIMQPGYAAITSTIPSILTNLTFAISKPTNFAGNGTVNCNLKLFMVIEFFDYIDTLTSLWNTPEDKEFLRPNCGGCWAASQVESDPCVCGTVDKCTNCFYTRKCQNTCRSSRCPVVKQLNQIYPPVLQRSKSSKQVTISS